MEEQSPNIGEVRDVIYASQMSGFKATLLSAALFLVSLAGGSSPLALLGMIFFGLGAVVGLVAAVAPARLELATYGFSQYVLWNRNSFLWNEIENIHVVQITRFRSTVAFNCASGSAPTGSQINRAALGVDFTLNSGFDNPADLAARLQTEKQRSTFS